MQQLHHSLIMILSCSVQQRGATKLNAMSSLIENLHKWLYSTWAHFFDLASLLRDYVQDLCCPIRYNAVHWSKATFPSTNIKTQLEKKCDYVYCYGRRKIILKDQLEKKCDYDGPARESRRNSKVVFSKLCKPNLCSPSLFLLDQSFTFFKARRYVAPHIYLPAALHLHFPEVRHRTNA